MSTTRNSAALAAALKDLRETARLTQNQLATGFTTETPVSGPTISSWESPTSPKQPNRERIADYARFFATDRSLAPTPHLVPLDDLTESEEAQRASIEARLLASLGQPHAPTSEPRSTFTFESGPLTVICPEAPRDDRSHLADPSHPNFTKLHQYADADSLLELWGHLRACNPGLEVKHRIPADVRADDMSAHVVLLGGIVWNPVTRRFQDALKQLPITQVQDPGYEDGEIFTVGEERYLPTWDQEEMRRDGTPALREDVAMLARVANPFNSSFTLTICNGIYGRGVYGAVRCLTDTRVRDANERYLAQAHPDGQFAMLLRVPVVDNSTMSPDLQNPSARLYEWQPEGSPER